MATFFQSFHHWTLVVKGIGALNLKYPLLDDVQNAKRLLSNQVEVLNKKKRERERFSFAF